MALAAPSPIAAFSPNHFSGGIRQPAFGVSALVAPGYQAIPFKRPITSTFRPDFGTSQSPHITEHFETSRSPHITEHFEFPSFSPEEWISQFEHNLTHVKIPAGNETLDLSWEDELVNLLILRIITVIMLTIF